MSDDALMWIIFLLVYLLIYKKHCKFITKSKNYKPNDIIPFLIVDKVNEKVAFVYINR